MSSTAAPGTVVPPLTAFSTTVPSGQPAASAKPSLPVSPSPSSLDLVLRVRLGCVACGLVLLGVSLVGRWLRPGQEDIFSLGAMLGLTISAVPVLFDALTSLKSDGFEATKYYMDQFVALAVLACFAAGQYVTGAIVAAILITGQVLEERAVLGVEEAVNTLARLARVKARRLRAREHDQIDLIDATDLLAGDHVRVLPGDTVPADGVILSGDTTLDQKLITGESLPVEAATGSKVFAGTSNLTGAIDVEVGATGDATVLGRVRQIVEEAKTSRAPVMRLIDDYTRYYLPLVLVIAGFTLFFTRELERAIAVIIVAMPCAFVLASPSAMVAALAVASRFGLLVKSSRFFEVARTIDTVVFDKTGTLTTGQLRLIAIRPAAGYDENTLLALAAAAEAQSTHPVARAVVAAAADRKLVLLSSEKLEETHGLGVRTSVAGRRVVLGRRSWLEQQGIALPAHEPDTDASASALVMALDGVYAGTLLLADSLREEATDAIDALRAEGITRFVMLTGDRASVAATIAPQAGITEWRADCLPAEKLAEVERLKRGGARVLVVGDGVNDAPALAAGDLGVAMGTLGSNVAIQTADVALMSGDLRNLPRFLVLARRTLTLINQNVLCGLAFIALFIALSVAGVISPIGAAVLHEFSAFFVILNSARLLKFDDPPAR